MKSGEIPFASQRLKSAPAVTRIATTFTDRNGSEKKKEPVFIYKLVQSIEDWGEGLKCDFIPCRAHSEMQTKENFCPLNFACRSRSRL